MLAIRAVDAEEEVQVPTQDDVVHEHVEEEVATDVVSPTPTSPLPPSPVIPSTPPHQSPSPPQSQAVEGSSQLIQQGRMTVDMEIDEGIELEVDQEKDAQKEDEEIIKSINETPAQKAAKRRKLNEEAQKADNLIRRLEIVPEEDDDVFVEAVPLAQKAPVVD
nr:hypothetical protein [Tanacetum cinerariifolium]